MKKIFLTSLACLSIYFIPSQLPADSVLERVVTDVVLGVYDKPHYYDKRPYYYYNNSIND